MRKDLLFKTTFTWTAAFVFAASCQSQGQSYTADWFAITPGAVSSNANYSLRGVIGQTDGHLMTGSSYEVSSGFFAILSVVQEPGAPVLSIAATGTNVIISWPAGFGGFILQRKSNLNSPQDWAAAGLPVNTVGGTNTVIVPIAGSAVYRLRR